MDRVRLAIVGCGNISQLNAPGYLQHPQCEVYALCDTVQERAERRAQQWGIRPKIYHDYTQVLNDSHIDAVELLTPTYLHAPQIIAALQAGKHVSCQKPLCPTVAEADQIIAAVGKANTLFRVTENFIYYPPILKAKELLDAGAIGEPSLVRIHSERVDDIADPAIEFDPDATVWRRDPARNPGGLLYDDGVHKYAVAMKWIGEIDKIQAIVERTPDFIMEAPSAAIWRFKNKHCLGMLDYTYAPQMIMRGKYVRVDEFFEIHGSRGVIWVTRCSGEMLDLPPVMVLKGTETVSYQVPMDWIEGFHGAARDFIDSILQGRQPELDAQASKKILQVALAIYEAARTERPVAPESIR
jgi:predicted dehydrogenase